MGYDLDLRKGSTQIAVDASFCAMCTKHGGVVAKRLTNDAASLQKMMIKSK